jgi:competence protein ComEC
MATPGTTQGWRIAAGGGAWLAGMALQLQQPWLWPAGHYMLVVAGALLLIALGVGGRRHGWARLAWPVALALLAFGSTGWRADQRLGDRLDAALEGRELMVTGVVSSLPQTGATGTRFRFDAESATLDGQLVRLPTRLALGWFAAEADDTPGAGLTAGQRWRLPVKLKQPHGAMNPHGFDAELWLWEQGVRATGFVRASGRAPPPRLLAERVAHPVERQRQRLRDALLRSVDDPRAAGVLAALVVGDQAAIERADWDLYRATGVAHLMSISGLHVTMFAWLAGHAIGWAWRRWPGAALRLPAVVAGGWGGLLAAAAYALLAGWGVPAQRTVLMLAVGVLLRSAGWRWPWLLVLVGAAVAVTALDPWSLLQPGFWLSFAAVGLLLASETPRSTPVARGWHAPLVGLLRSQAVATLGLAPLSLVCFQQLSLVGFIANLAAIPLVTLLITPLALLGAVVAPLWWLAAALVQGLGAALAWLAAWPGGVWSVGAAPAWAIASGLAAAVVLLLPLPWRVRAMALPLSLPLLVPHIERPAPGRFELVAADVGQGTAVLVRTRQHLLVYDTGPQYSAENDAGHRVLLPLLRARGEGAPDVLLLSHRDSDHVGGAASLIAAVPPRRLLSSLEEGHPVAARVERRERCAAGQSWRWDGVQFELLHPLPGDEWQARKPNAISCVLRVSDALGRSVLLTGDIEAAQEAALVQRSGPALGSDILIVPHHGSRTSSTAAFLQAVQPAIAVVQAGYRSRFGHPAADVMARYAALGIPVVRTDRCGAWMWHDGAAACTRDVRRRYWHWQAPRTGASGTQNAPPGEGTRPPPPPEGDRHLGSGPSLTGGGANVAIPSSGEGKQ